MSKPAPVSVVETPEFLAATRRMMTDEERGLLVDYLAYNPVAGDLILARVEGASSAGGWKDAANGVARGWSVSTTARQCRCSR